MLLFATHKQICELNIGYKIPENQNEDVILPWNLDQLKVQAEKHFGISSNTAFKNFSENNDSKGVCTEIVVEFPHKECRLNCEEINMYGLKFGLLTLNNPIDVFQRLLQSDEIDFEDLSIAGAECKILDELQHRCEMSIDDFYGKISLLLAEEIEDDRFKSYFESFIGTDELNFWLYGVN